MKRLLSLSLAVSVLLNVGLIVVLVAGKLRPTPRLPAQTTASSPRALVSSAQQLEAATWESLRAGDLPSLVTRLRESGFPPAVVRAIVMSELQEEYAARRKAIDPGAESRAFWKNTTFDPKVLAALRQLGREQQKMLRDLLGADAEPDDPMSRARDARQFGHLSTEKATEARRIVWEFNEIRSDFFTSYGGGSISITQADREKMTALDRQMQAELRKIMTPAEWDSYQLRGSNTANSLRSQLATFDATESEFRMLFQLQSSFDERFGPMYSRPSQEEMRQRSEAQRQLQEQIKAALGPARAVELERSRDYEFRLTSQLAARLELPPETATKVWDIRDDFQKRAQALRQNPTIDPDLRNQQLGALEREAIDRVTPLVGGTRGLEAYRQYGGRWLDQLSPLPRPTTAPSR